MSYYRDSPSKRSPYSRSPARVLQSQRDFIEEQVRIKNAYRSEAQNRRLIDQISLLQIKNRKTDQLQVRCDALLKQNALLADENDHLAKELSERRFQNQRIRSTTVQLQERDAFKSTQLGQINRSLQIQIDLLKKERIQSNKLYQSHIQKLELMLEDKIRQIDALSLKCNDLLNQKQISQIRFEQQRNKLKNLMSRTSYDMEREIQYTRQKQTTQKYVEIQTLKKNYTSQIILLQDQITKLKAANSYKNNQFQNQLLQNKSLKNRYEEQVRNLNSENDNLRQRILKLQLMNRTQVQNIQGKYSDIHYKGTSNLKQQHQREIKLLLDQIDREKWIINQKNTEIQHLIREKRDQQNAARQRELALNSQIDTLKNKLYVQETESAAHAHQLMNKINEQDHKSLRESQNYHQRVKDFQKKINNLQSQINFKQDQYDQLKSASDLRIKQLQRSLQQISSNLRRTSKALQQSEQQRVRQASNHKQYKQNSQNQRRRLSEQISSLEAQNERLEDKLNVISESNSNTEQLLKIEINSLKQTIAVLQEKLSAQQRNHSKQMNQLSSNLREKIKKLQENHRLTIDQINQSHTNEINTSNRRIQKLNREKTDMEAKLKEYISLYEGLEKYFQKPHEGAIFKEKGSSNIYQVLSKTSQSTIHIF